MMKEFSFHIEEKRLGGWDIKMFIEPETQDLSRVCSTLAGNGCVDGDLDSAIRPIIKGEWNSGFTHTNKQRRSSVTATINSASRSDFLNTLSHEIRHIERHICDALGIDPYSEDAAYLSGALSEAIYPHITIEICGCEK